MSRRVVLRGEKLFRTYGAEGVEVHALQDASFEIFENEFIVVLGHSGSGKSTLLNLIGAMDRPTSGKIWHGEKELTAYTDRQLSDYRRDTVGFIFQFFNLIPSLTALENVELAANIVKEPMDPKEVLSMVALTGREGHFPSQLSGGEQQRVSIARAIVKNPALLLCDEPTGALDSKSSLMVVRFLMEVRNRLGCPIITITHNAAMAQIADRVFHMKDGRIESIVENAAPLPVEELEW